MTAEFGKEIQGPRRIRRAIYSSRRSTAVSMQATAACVYRWLLILISTASFRRRFRPKLFPLGSSQVSLLPPRQIVSRLFRGTFLDLLQQAPRQHRPELSSTLVHALLHQVWVDTRPAAGQEMDSMP